MSLQHARATTDSHSCEHGNRFTQKSLRRRLSRQANLGTRDLLLASTVLQWGVKSWQRHVQTGETLCWGIWWQPASCVLRHAAGGGRGVQRLRHLPLQGVEQWRFLPPNHRGRCQQQWPQEEVLAGPTPTHWLHEFTWNMQKSSWKAGYPMASGAAWASVFTMRTGGCLKQKCEGDHVLLSPFSAVNSIRGGSAFSCVDMTENGLYYIPQV